MAGDERPSSDLVSLKDSRERAIARLSEAFAGGDLDVDEFERRLTLAHRASSIADIEQTVADLTASESKALRIPTHAPAPQGSRIETSSDTVVAIFGGAQRHGSWTLPKRLSATAVMGGIVLDFRDVILPPGMTEVRVVAVMGGVQLIVPPTLSVEVSGTAVCGGFGHVERIPAQTDPEQPVLRVHGLALFGGVAVETRLPGESEHDAHCRRRRDRRAAARGNPTRRLPAKTFP